MSKIADYQQANTTGVISTQNLDDIFNNTGNLYQSIVIVAKRANQIANELKTELHFKLEDMRKITDEIDEITESREQIELSKKYEKLAHPTLIATSEFLEGNLEYKHLDEI